MPHMHMASGNCLRATTWPICLRTHKQPSTQQASEYRDPRQAHLMQGRLPCMHKGELPRIREVCLLSAAGARSGHFEEEDAPRARVVLSIVQGSAHCDVWLKSACLSVAQPVRCHRAGLLSRVQCMARHSLVAAGLQQPHLRTPRRCELTANCTTP